MLGMSLKSQGVTHARSSEKSAAREISPPYYSVKEAVFPFIKFPGVDTILGPEMKSTGEVMGVGESFAEAFVKSQLAAGVKLPSSGRAFISVRDADKAGAVEVARSLLNWGFSLSATRGTALALQRAGLDVSPVNKVVEGRPHIVDMIKNGEIHLIVNTSEGKRSIQDSASIRHAALQHNVTYYTTLAGARAACMGLQHMREFRVYDLQGLHRKLLQRTT
jgi:carbamoyl-phosphate synthase large subunit